MNRGTIPSHREARTDDALAIQRIRGNAIKSFNQSTRRDTRHIREVTVTFPQNLVHRRDLPEVSRTATKIHKIQNIGLEQSVCLLNPTSLVISKHRVHHLSHRHIIDAPLIWRPIRGTHGLIFLALIYIRYVRDMSIHILGRPIVLFRRTYTAIDRSIYAP